MKIPGDLKYSKTDEWVKVDGKAAIIGITDYAQSQLSDIVYFEFKVDAGENVKKGGTAATVESVKAAADVNFPVSGKVVELNESVVDQFEGINSKPYDTWFLKVEMSDLGDLNALMDAAEYEKYCAERGH
ncbi:MAG TPA: glycine cleavage system protein H [Anaerolineaceae bacterium]|nr:MAG: glycine cleavage system protein H [Chloroflexi bacterium GWB2_54_36]HAL17801.1 glycine cleavage system protein H [Anaerolineaceae bacterium]HBA92571.1 glycine cleavage system protein H [Anaerolineaceae bacterium]